MIPENQAKTWVLPALFAALLLPLLGGRALAQVPVLRAEQTWIHTSQVIDADWSDGEAWALTPSAIEIFEAGGNRKHLVPLELGSPSALHVFSKEVEVQSSVGSCRSSRQDIVAGAPNFICRDRGEMRQVSQGIDFTEDGRRITLSRRRGGRLLEAVQGRGLRMDGQLLTQSDLPGAHVTSLALLGGSLWVGTFDQGLLTMAGKATPSTRGFRKVETPFRMINGLTAAYGRLYVASHEGLFVSPDGSSFSEVELAFYFGTKKSPHVNDVASDGTNLWVLTTSALLRLPMAKGAPLAQSFWTPAGSHSLQRMHLSDRRLLIATEDRGLILIAFTPRGIVKRGAISNMDATTGLASSWYLDGAILPDGSFLGASLDHGFSLLRTRRTETVLLKDTHRYGLTVENGTMGTWLGTQSGAFLYRDGELVALQGLPNPRVHAFLEAEWQGKKGVFVGTESGLAFVMPSAPF